MMKVSVMSCKAAFSVAVLLVLQPLNAFLLPSRTAFVGSSIDSRYSSSINSMRMAAKSSPVTMMVSLAPIKRTLKRWFTTSKRKQRELEEKIAKKKVELVEKADIKL